MTKPPISQRPRPIVAAALVLILGTGAVIAGLFPLSIYFGIAAGGVLDSGQAEPMRWWLGGVGAFILYALLSWRWSLLARLWWGLVLAASLLSAVLVFTSIASSGQMREGRVAAPVNGPDLKIGIISALPLFRAEGLSIADHIAGEGGQAPSPVTRYPAHAIDHVDAASLKSADSLLIAQPRLLQPDELVALDGWIRAGGRAVILADPLLIWHSDYALGDSRRPPMTSLLDPLLSHWGLRLLPAPQDRPMVERRMLTSGHVLLLSGASRFARIDGVRPAGVDCRFAEQALMALCHVGAGQVRLIADADLLDERLWLTDARWPNRPEAWAADVPALLDHMLAAPASDAAPAAPRRVRDEEALPCAMRFALILLLVGAGIGRLLWKIRSGKAWDGPGRAASPPVSSALSPVGGAHKQGAPRTKREQDVDGGKEL